MKNDPGIIKIISENKKLMKGIDIEIKQNEKIKKDILNLKTLKGIDILNRRHKRSKKRTIKKIERYVNYMEDKKSALNVYHMFLPKEHQEEIKETIKKIYEDVEYYKKKKEEIKND